MAKSVELPSYRRLKSSLPTVLDLNTRFPSRAEGNKTDGMLVYSSKNLAPFRGFDPETERRTMPVIAELDTASGQDMHERVSSPLLDIAQSHGISLALLPQTHFPYHITLQKFRYGIDSTTTQAAIDQTINQLAPQLMDASSGVRGITVPLNRLVLAGSNLYICVDDPTRNEETFAAFWRILESRNAINSVYRKSLADPFLAHSGRILNDDDIIHASIGRVIGLTPDADLLAFAQDAYEAVGREITDHPVLAVISGVYSGSTFNYMKQH